jgi:hypothetical protein
LTSLAPADPPPANDAKQLAGNMAHAARLVRSIVEDRLAELTEAEEANAPLQAVRDEFREVLYTHPEAAGYDAKRFDPLVAAAFAQTLAFGLLLVREATHRAGEYQRARGLDARFPISVTAIFTSPSRLASPRDATRLQSRAWSGRSPLPLSNHDSTRM